MVVVVLIERVSSLPKPVPAWTLVPLPLAPPPPAPPTMGLLVVVGDAGAFVAIGLPKVLVVLVTLELIFSFWFAFKPGNKWTIKKRLSIN